jgi:meso-butanediol dehydrogenase/(S,S)-butanediol dehydrogenase/diacetyl reductase
MNRRLEGKVAVVTGSGGDIARAIAVRFAEEGATIVGSDINAELAEGTIAAVEAVGGTIASLHPLDLSTDDAGAALAAFAEERFGGADILVNNAKAAKGGSGESTSTEDWRSTLDMNLTMPWTITKAFIPLMRSRGGGSVIFLASVSGASFGTGYPGNLSNLIAYSTAKAGILKLSTALAVELGPSGIRVNTISPGIINTAVAMRSYGQPGTPRHNIVAKAAVLPRTLGLPVDIANGALFLASDEAGWVTGIDLKVDGGWSASGGVGPATRADIEALATV